MFIYKLYRRENLPRIWAILNGFLSILSPLISIITHHVAKAFDFQGILILNLTQTPFQYGNSEMKMKQKHQTCTKWVLNSGNSSHIESQANP